MRFTPHLSVVLVTLINTATAQTVTVTTAADVIDINPQTATTEDLPGPDGVVSFSEAMIATNNTPGHQTIGFAIPQSEWILQFILPGRAVITSSVGFYFRAFDSVTIDGSTQTAFTGDTNPNGWEVAFYRNEVYLNADDCTLMGIDNSSFTVTGSNASILGNTGGMNISVFSGSGNLIQDNNCGTIKIDRSDGNIIVGNTTQRVRVWGFGTGSPARDNRIGGPTVAERNFITGYGTWNSEGLPSGTTVQLFHTTGTQIENNWIGTTPDGMSQGNLASNVGIGFEGDNRNVVVRNNLIAGIRGQGRPPHQAGRVYGWAIYFTGTGSDIQLVSNSIGLDASGAPTLGSVWGIEAGHASSARFTDVTIGGTGPGEGNIVAGHLFNGVTVGRLTTGVRLVSNSIYGNGSLGIDLIPTGFGFGPTPNDPLDADTGGNGLQNYPTVAAATSDGSQVRVVGALHSTPANAFTLEFFASPACDPSGNGEGELPLGTTAVVTDAVGDASFDAVLATAAPAGWVVAATATAEPDGSTSEFSPCVPIVARVCQSNLGFQGPGSASATLCGTGLGAGESSVYEVTGAPGSAPGALFVSLNGFANITAFGGTLASFGGFAVQLPIVAQSTGRFAGTFPGSPPPAFDLVFQSVLLDAATPAGIAFTNALLARYGR